MLNWFEEGMNHHNDMGNGLCPGRIRNTSRSGGRWQQACPDNEPGAQGTVSGPGLSDASPKWTRRIKQTRLYAKADGTFWMTMEDWCGAFNQFYWNSRERMEAIDCDFETGMRVKAITDFCYNRDKTHKVRRAWSHS